MGRLFLCLVASMLVIMLVGCSGSQRPDNNVDGESLYQQTVINQAPGCITCHSLEPGVKLVGPSLAGVAVRAEELISAPGYSGSATTAAEYLRESIIEPDMHVPEGYISGTMYQDYESKLSAIQVDALVNYLSSLK